MGFLGQVRKEIESTKNSFRLKDKIADNVSLLTPCTTELANKILQESCKPAPAIEGNL